MALTIILLLIFSVIALLIMPIHVRINTEEGHIMEKPGFLKLNIDLDGHHMVSVILYVFYVGFTWHPLRKRAKKKVKIKGPVKRRRFNLLTRNRLKFLIHVAWQFIQKSKLENLYLNLDTSNVIINANLFPVFEFMNKRRRVNLNINYTGNFTLILDVRNNLWNLAQILIRNLVRKIFIFNK